MSWKNFVLLGTAVLLACALVGLAQAAHDIGLNDATDTCYIYKPDTTEGHYAITSFFVTYYDSTTGKPISYFTPPEPITPWEKAKFRGADDVAFRSAVDSQGNIHIVWMTDKWTGDRKWEIAYEKFTSDGSPVDSAILVSDLPYPEQSLSAYPAIAIDSNDDAHIVWMDERDGNWEIYYSKVSSDGVDLTVPDVCISDRDGYNSGRYIEPIDTAGNYCEWETVAGFQQGTGNPIVAVHTAFIEHPDICVDGGDTVHIVWSDYREEEAGEHYWQVYYQSQTNAPIPQVVVDDANVTDPLWPIDAISPAIAAGPRVTQPPHDFGIHIVWQERDYWQKWRIFYRLAHSGDGSYIITRHQVSGGTDFNSASPDIAVDNSGFVHIAFMDDRDIDPGHGEKPGQNDIHIDGQWEVYVAGYQVRGSIISPFRTPKRESDLTTTDNTTPWGDPLYGEYTGPGSPANQHDCPSMYPQVSAAGDSISGWTNVTWQDYRNQNWDVYYAAMSNIGECPQADIQLTSNPRPDKYPCISKENTEYPDIAFQRKVDLGYGPEWEGYHCRWNGKGQSKGGGEYVRVTVMDSTTDVPVGDYYLFQMDPTDTNAWDGVDYMWTMPLPQGTYRYQFRASIDAGATEVHTTPKYAAVPSLSNDRTGTVSQAPLTHPLQFSLGQNYPNPFNAATALNYTIPQVIGERFKVKGGPNTSHLIPVTLKVYNILGEEVRTLVDGEQSAGSYQVVWDGRDSRGKPVASGVYLCRLKVQGDRLKVAKTRKVILLR